jgi:histidinol-phosphatase (PHP family)
MEQSCERAIELGLPAIAFTDHADFVKVHPDQYCVDIAGYLDCVERRRAKFPELRILSGVELGEPHWFPKETAAVLGAGPLDQVLGSIHCIKLDGKPLDASQFRGDEGIDFAGAVRTYFREVLAMIESSQPFETLAHLDYPKRYWPEGSPPYKEKDFEPEIRGGPGCRGRTGRVIEVNTTREGRLVSRPLVVRWCARSGQAVQYGATRTAPTRSARGLPPRRHRWSSSGRASPARSRPRGAADLKPTAPAVAARWLLAKTARSRPSAMRCPGRWWRADPRGRQARAPVASVVSGDRTVAARVTGRARISARAGAASCSMRTTPTSWR